MRDYVDVIVPRGGKGLIERLERESRESWAETLLDVLRAIGSRRR